MSRDYIIAGLRIRFHEPCADMVGSGLPSFKRFEADFDDTAVCVAEFCLDRRPDIDGFRVLHTFDFPDAGQICMYGTSAESRIFVMRPEGRDDAAADTIFVLPFGSRVVESNIACDGAVPDPSLLRFGIWMMFSLTMVDFGATMVHTSVIVKDGFATLFLGESGTGKSTHTRLWRENIEGAVLLNDDSPVVRIVDGVAVAYGSPWSGKTHCYVNRGFPVRGIVRLSQGARNEIRRLDVLRAFGAVYPSCPPSLAYDDELQDKVCDIVGSLISGVSVWHLSCLPDVAAAIMSYESVFEKR